MTTILASISLTLPAMLGGLALLGLPILAHLLHRKAKRTIVFPSIELLAASSASHASLLRLRRWLLLFLRCLAITLLVLGFAQPLWVTNPAGAANPQRGVGVVLLVDVSASTAQQSRGVSAMQTMQAAAGRTLDSLLTGADTANLIVGSARPSAVFPQMTANLDAVRAELMSLEPTHERMDLPAALGLAGRLLDTAQGQRHLVIVTDLQADNWDELTTNPARENASGWSAALPPNTRVTIVPSDATPPGNVGLSHAAARPATPIVNRPAQVAVRVTNHSDTPTTATVGLLLEGKTAGSVTLDLAPREARDVALPLKFETEGEHRLTFTLGRDALDVDNRRHMIVRTVSRVPVALIGDDHPDRPGAASYFLARALTPRGDQRDSYRLQHLTTQQITASALRDFGVVFVSQAHNMPDASLRTLYAFMQRGGSVVIFTGQATGVQHLAALDALDPGGLLPWAPGPLRDLSFSHRPLRITGGQSRSPLLNLFDLNAREAMAHIRFHHAASATPLRADARALLVFNDGSPALADRAVGEGRVVLAGFSPAASDSDLSKHGTFVALVQSLADHLQPVHTTDDRATAGRSVQLNPGQPLRTDGPTIVVVGPGRQPLPTARVAVDAGRAFIAIDRAAEPGFYAALQGAQPLGQIAVNIDERESNLRRIDPDALTTALQAAGVTSRIHGASDPTQVLDLRGLPLWGWMLVTATAVLAVEMFLLGVWRR